MGTTCGAVNAAPAPGPGILAQLAAPWGMIDDGAGGFVIAGMHGWVPVPPAAGTFTTPSICADGNCLIRRYNALTGLISNIAGLGASSCGYPGTPPDGIFANASQVATVHAVGSDGTRLFHFAAKNLIDCGKRVPACVQVPEATTIQTSRTCLRTLCAR